MKSLSHFRARQLVSELVGAGGEMEFGKLVQKLRLPYSSTNQLVKQLAGVDIVRFEGGPRTGWRVSLNKKFRIPAINPDLIYESVRGMPRLPTE